MHIMGPKAKPTKKVTRVLACPACRKSMKYNETNPFRPFCSERCQIQDAAAWADDKYAIAGKPVSDEEIAENNTHEDLSED